MRETLHNFPETTQRWGYAVMLTVFRRRAYAPLEGAHLNIVASSSSSSAGATVHDEPWLLLRILFFGPDPVTFVSI
jgi:hypothetical protein